MSDGPSSDSNREKGKSMELTRRNFLQWSAAAAGVAGLTGLAACGKDPEPTPEPTPAPTPSHPDALVETGKWLTAPCKYNCCCGASRCLIRVYVENGVPLKIRTDMEEDTLANPQRRACPRGNAMLEQMTSPCHIKYPMKRKNWSPDNPNGQLRGKDEWERISWDEALQYIADELKKNFDKYGKRSLLACSPGNGFGVDPLENVIYQFGGAIHNVAGTVSFGSWSVADTHMVGGYGASNGPHHLQMRECQLHVMYGNNWVSNKGGNHGHFLQMCRENGGKIIIIDPWLNQTAQTLADEWIPVLPGGDTALTLAICYQWIVDGTYDQAYLDKYCVGFDADHMPASVDPKENFKDYVLGTYDGQPKDAAWAEPKSGTPAETIVALAKEIAAVDKVNFFAGQSTSKTPAGEQFVQAFYTMALMHGGIGTPGHYMGWRGMGESNAGSLAAGGSGTPCPNPLEPAGSPIYMLYPIPQFVAMADPDAWDMLEPSESWVNVDQGWYGRDCWPTGKKTLDIHQIYHSYSMSSINQYPNTNVAVKVNRRMDFVWGTAPFFDSTREYCDIVLPTTTYWEDPSMVYSGEASAIFWNDNIFPPAYEAKSAYWIAWHLAEKCGFDPKALFPVAENQLTYNTAAAASITYGDTGETKPLLTLTQNDIAAFGADVVGQPQQGVITLAELKETGIYKYPVTQSSKLNDPFAAFIADPEAYPLPTASGKFEICCPTLAYMINSVGYSIISPIAKWQIGDPEQGIGTQTAEFPLLLWTPHSLRRAHSVMDHAYYLREAFPQECFMSSVDAAERGIKNGDLVLMSSPYGKVLRHAKVMPNIIPGAVALQDGSWSRFDEATGIDLGGNPNVLQSPKSSGGGSQSWSGTLCQVEKYNGPLTLDPDKNVPLVLPVGIE